MASPRENWRRRVGKVWVQSGEAAFSRLYLYLYLFFLEKCAMCVFFFGVNTFTCVAGVAPKCSCESELWVSYDRSEWSSLSSSTPGKVKWKWMDRLYSTLLDEVLIFCSVFFSWRFLVQTKDLSDKPDD